MKRRGFLKSLLAAVALSPVVCRLAEGFGVQHEQGEEKPLWGKQINPAYEEAAYEVSLCYHGDFAWEVPDWDERMREEIPRYNFVNGEFVRVKKHLG